MRPDAAMIFCAGFGTRMGALTADLPKPLLRVGGETLFDRMHGLARKAGIGRVVINAHYRAEAMEAHVAGMDIAVSREAPEILETGGGLKAALPLLGEGPVYTANPDVVWAGPNPFEIVAGAWAEDIDALLLCVPVARAIGRETGDFAETADGSLRRQGPVIYGGMQIIRPGVVARMAEERFSLNLVWDALMAEGRVRYSLYPGWWCDVGTPEGIGQAEQLIEDHAGA
ncbi:nucleotidyltransferase family protein [Ovoidimarina sediminis]|uniref:nucleotidyltransferase family protein n=1 Tax=Ovoidimarina sediminis TaxID=3079856 RepID=UPI00290FB9F5|nr:nucleotidyltransferase family protein [Rhodophyticola sp. MJ-SS7]MDU8942518.1 nucleotidyltransferase family protein [Rhodophyticola sp. MJ-SS7]